MELLALHDLVEGWPAAAPPSLEQLCDAPLHEILGELRDTDVPQPEVDLVVQLRAQGMDLKQAADKLPPLSGPSAVLKALRNGWLKPRALRWMTYPLDERRRRVTTANSAGGARYVTHISNKVPSPDELPPVPTGGTYLLLFGGSPAVLEIPGVPQRLRKLTGTAPVSDVVFWHLTREHPDTLFSLKFAAADRGGSVAEFGIDPTVLKEARSCFD